MDEIASGIAAMAIPLSPGTLGMYVVRGDSVALIDTGYLCTLPEVDGGLAALGLRRDDVDLVVMTHGHADHVGACAALGGGARAEALLHAADVPLAAGAGAQLESRVEIVATLRELGAADAVAARTAFLEANVEPIAGVQPLHDGDAIELGGGRTLDVVATPGHTPGSVTLVCEADDVAFVGDAVQAWGGRHGVLPLYFDPADYERSVRRIRSLGIGTLALGHPFRWSGASGNPPLVRSGKAAAETLEDSLAYAEAAASAATRAVAEAPDSPRELAERAVELLGPPFWAGGQDWELASAAALLAYAKAAGGPAGPRATADA